MRPKQLGNINGSGLLNNFITAPGSLEVFQFNSTQGSSTSTLVPIRDRLGSTIGLVSSTGTLQTQYTYDPFGNVTTTGQSSSYPFLFAGMEMDAATGLYHLQSRYYSPNLQRFLSEDPKGFDGGDSNFFAYVGNSPTNRIDPLGQAWWDDNGDGSDDSGDDQSNNSSGTNLLGFWPIHFFNHLFGGHHRQFTALKARTPHHVPECGLIGVLYLCLDQTDSAEAETMGHIPVINRPAWYYRYCGYGSYPGRSNGPTDKCCEGHDECYAEHGFTGKNVKAGHPGSAGPAQAECDSQLCECVEGANPTGWYDNLMQHGIIQTFCGDKY